MHVDVHGHESVDLAVAIALRSARSRRARFDERGLSAVPASRRRNPILRVGRRLMRGPLGRLRTYLNAPLENRLDELSSRLDQVAISGMDRRRSEIAALSLAAQVVGLREEIVALRAEFASGHREPTKPARGS